MIKLYFKKLILLLYTLSHINITTINNKILILIVFSTFNQLTHYLQTIFILILQIILSVRFLLPIKINGGIL